MITTEKDVFPLSGVLKCSLCDYTFSSYTRNKKRFYRCTGYSKKHICEAGPKAVIEAEKIENIIKKEIIAEFKHYAISYNSIINKEELESLKTNLENLRKERDNLIAMPYYQETNKAKFISICNKIKQIRDEISNMEDNNMNYQCQLFEKIANNQNFTNMDRFFKVMSLMDAKNLYKNLIRIDFNPINKTGTLKILPHNNIIEAIPFSL